MIEKKTDDLKEYIAEKIKPDWKKRNFVGILEGYFAPEMKTRKVLIISGLRGMGKTCGILQYADKKEKASYYSAEYKGESSEELFEKLKVSKEEIIIVDEYTWFQPDKRVDSLLASLADKGKKVILTGTESMSLDYFNVGRFIHRTDLLNVNYFPFSEYARLYDLDKNKENYNKFLMEGGVFKDYIIDSFDGLKNYIETAIIGNLMECVENLDETKAKNIIYTILYRAVCDSFTDTVPELKADRRPIANFLSDFGVDVSLKIDNRDFNRVSNVLEKTGVITTVKNLVKEEEYRTYITNPAMCYQLILAVYDNEQLKPHTNDILGHIHEALCVTGASYNLIGDNIDNDTLYYINTDNVEGVPNSEIDFVIIDEPKRKRAYLFECKMMENTGLKKKASIISDKIEDLLGETEILGRYVICNSEDTHRQYDGKDVIFTGTEDILSRYWDFENIISSLS